MYNLNLLKAGDKVKVVSLWGNDEDLGIKIGDTYTVSSSDSDGNICIETPEGIDRLMLKHQVEKVGESADMEAEVKVGDKIEITHVFACDRNKGIKVGDVYTVNSVDYDGGVRVTVKGNEHYVMDQSQFTKNVAMNFAEMAAKLIAGEFAVGTELVASGYSYFVGRGMRGYGLKDRRYSGTVNTKLGSNAFNAAWTVKEEGPAPEPVKEMSIEELQKELGYKVKIVE